MLAREMSRGSVGAMGSDADVGRGCGLAARLVVAIVVASAACSSGASTSIDVEGVPTTADLVEDPFLTDPSGASLTVQEAGAILAEAERRMRSRPEEFDPAARCWLDEAPSETVTVVCGPTVGASPYESQIELGPPYYSVLLLDRTARADGSVELTLSNAAAEIFSFADYPVDLFRPDGETLRP